MWQELIWNIESLRGIIFFALGIVAAILLIPRILKRLQAEREKRLAKALLTHWGSDCIGAMMRLKPPRETIMQIEGYVSNTESSKYTSDEQTVTQFWHDIRDGKRNPDGAGIILGKAVERSLCSDEEWAMKTTPPDIRYPFHDGEPPKVPECMPVRWRTIGAIAVSSQLWAR